MPVGIYGIEPGSLEGPLIVDIVGSGMTAGAGSNDPAVDHINIPSELIV